MFERELAAPKSEPKGLSREDMLAAEEWLKDVVGGLDPQVLEGNFAAFLVDRFAAMERLCAAGKALAAGRVAASGAWRRAGDRSAAEWMARTQKTSLGEAAGVLQTAQRVAELPQTEQALREGKLSGPGPGDHLRCGDGSGYRG